MRKIIYSLLIAFSLIVGAFLLPPHTLAQGPGVGDECPGPGNRNGNLFCNCQYDAGGQIIQGSCRWAPDPQASGTTGASGNDPSLADKIWNSFKRFIGSTLIALGGAILYFAGVGLNLAFQYTLLGMSAWVHDMPVINVIWATFRDLANLMFIFVLIYLAVQLIVGVGKNTMKNIAAIVACALLINFSLFFTKVVIDVSNTVAFQFYSSIDGNSRNQAALFSPNAGLSWAFLKPMLITTVFKSDVRDLSDLSYSNVDLGAEVVLASVIMAFVFILVAAFVFLSIAIMLVIRFVTLIFLMATSPIYVMGMLLPQMKSTADKWLHQLIDQCLFAPVLMIGLWAVYKILSSPQFADQIRGQGFSGALQGFGTPENVIVFLNFLIVTAMLLMVLAAAKQVGGEAGKFGTAWAGKLSFGAAAAAGRNTFGRAASKLVTNEKFKDLAARSTIAKFAYKGTNYAATSKYDARSALGIASKTGVDLGSPSDKSYQDKLGAQVKSREEFMKTLGPTNKQKMVEQDEKISASRTAIAARKQAIEAQVTRQQLALDPTLRNDPNRLSSVVATALDADADVVRLNQDITDATNAKKNIEGERRKAYTDKLRTKGPLTLWRKVARNDKAAAAKIEIETFNKDKEKKEKDLNEIKADIKRLEQRKKQGGGILNAQEGADLDNAYTKKAQTENEIREIQLKINRNELVS